MDTALSDIQFGFALLLGQTWMSLVAIFWYTIIFEGPRYILPFIAAGFTQRTRQGADIPLDNPAVEKPTVSIILVGHNEEDALEACVRSLKEQSFNDFDIVIVSDGSVDKMSKVARDIVRRGDAACIISTDLRGGKSSGINLACNAAKGDIIINVDCDCSFDRYAIEHLIKPFEDPGIGGACGDIAPRNSHTSIMAQFQEIEYLQSISVGKRISSTVEQIVCASGAFGAFRREALESVGGFDVGGGEDLDVTIRLRKRGWRIAFAPEAVCYTDVPTTAFQYIRQRLRWERDAVWLRFGKHKSLFNPFSRRFLPAEAFHQWDFFVFGVVGAAVFPIYVIWLFATFGSFALIILIAMQIGLLCLDTMVLAISAWVTRRKVFWSNLPFIPGYSLFMTYVMRPVRLMAYIDEWAFNGSHRDNYTPIKVRLERPW
jgi:cellulose synthase/poly-beta-1,6-N-acetylglucosamine synthase-like glycosyltransferase